MSYTETLKKGQAYRVYTGKDEDGVSHYDRLSFYTSSDDVVFNNGDTLTETIEDMQKYASGILKAGKTSITINGSNLKENGMIEVYVPIAFNKVTPESITDLVDGSITLTFPSQTSDMEVRVICR